MITAEGPEGSGKSFQVKEISKYLTSRGVDHVLTREPGGVKIAEDIRKVLLNTENTAMDGRTEALLYAAARRQHLVEKIIPALNQGKVVVIDRFLDSSLSYQGYARGIGIEEVLKINLFALGEHTPDLTLLFDLPPEIGLKRIHANSSREVNRLDLETLCFHNKVREGYLKLKEMFPERIEIVDAEKTEEEVTKQALQIVKQILAKKGL